MDLVPNDAYTFLMIFVTFFLVVFIYLNNRNANLVTYRDVSVKELKTGSFESTWRQPANTVIRGISFAVQKPFSYGIGTLQLSVGTTSRGTDILPLTLVPSAGGGNANVDNYVGEATFPISLFSYTPTSRKLFIDLWVSTTVTNGGKGRIIIRYEYM